MLYGRFGDVKSGGHTSSRMPNNTLFAPKCFQNHRQTNIFKRNKLYLFGNWMIENIRHHRYFRYFGILLHYIEKTIIEVEFNCDQFLVCKFV